MSFPSVVRDINEVGPYRASRTRSFRERKNRLALKPKCFMCGRVSGFERVHTNCWREFKTWMLQQ